MSTYTHLDAVIWDWDGTLVDSFETIRQAYNVARTTFGLSAWTLEETHANVAKSGRDTFPAMFGQNADAAADIFYKTYAELAPKLVKAKPGRAALLQELVAANVPLAVVSNKRGDILRQECTALGWDGYFKVLIGSGDEVADKPDPAPMQSAAKKTGVLLSKKTPYVGDAPIDGEAAEKVGIPVILLAEETHQADLLAAARGAPRVVKFNELSYVLSGKG